MAEFVALGEPAARVAVPALTSRDSGQVRTAVDALVLIGDPGMRPLVRELRYGESPASMTIISLLGRIGTREAATQLIPLLAVRDTGLYTLVMATFEAIRESAVEPLGEALSDTNSEARMPDLTRTLGDPDWIRFRAATVLGRIGSQRAVPYLESALRDPRRQTRSVSCLALASIGGKRALELLVSTVGDKERFEQETVVAALSAIGKPATDTLVRLAKSVTPDSRLTALRALGQIADAKAVPVLIAALADTSSSVRLAGVVGLGRVGDKRAVVSLIVRLSDTGEKTCVRESAAAALHQFGDRRAVLARQTYSIELAARRVMPPNASLEVKSSANSRDRSDFTVRAHLLEGHSPDETSPYVRGDYGTETKLEAFVRRRCAEMINSIATKAEMPRSGRIVIEARHGVRTRQALMAIGGTDIARTLYSVSVSIEKLRDLDWGRAQLEEIMGIWKVESNILPTITISSSSGGLGSFKMPTLPNLKPIIPPRPPRGGARRTR